MCSDSFTFSRDLLKRSSTFLAERTNCSAFKRASFASAANRSASSFASSEAREAEANSIFLGLKFYKIVHKSTDNR